MSLPEMGLLQSAALVGYLLGQVCPAGLKTMHAAAHTFTMSSMYRWFTQITLLESVTRTLGFNAYISS